MKPWIGVDLDGTLAEYQGWQGVDQIGKPIPAMMERVKEWLAQGLKVKIMTARVSGDKAEAVVAQHYIEKWLADNGLPDLEVTCTKDYGMTELYDDRAIQVIMNTGELVGFSTRRYGNTED